jgi:hypothetical protein
MQDLGVMILKVGGVLAFSLFITYAIYKLIITRLKMINIPPTAQTAIVLGIVFLIFALSFFAVNRLTTDPPREKGKANIMMPKLAIGWYP